MDKFQIMKDLGKGSFATVSQVLRKDDNQLYAIKRVKLPNMPPIDREHALNEVRILASFVHPNIISYKESFYTEETKTLDIIMEYAEGGDLLSLIKKTKNNKETISENIIWMYLIQMLFGLRALHEKKFIHRDLKSANVFLCKGNIAKIGDFNVTKRLKTSTYLQTQTGTPYYASPEIWLEKPYDMRTDIWSLGCIIYELCALQVPFLANSIPQLCKSIVKGEYKKIPSIYSKDLDTIATLLLVGDIKKRMTSEELLKHSLIVKKIESLKIYDSRTSITILDTIKLPKRKEDFNSVLPKVKKYASETNLISIAKFDRATDKALNAITSSNRDKKERPKSSKLIGRAINQSSLDKYNNEDNDNNKDDEYMKGDNIGGSNKVYIRRVCPIQLNDIVEKKEDNELEYLNQIEEGDPLQINSIPSNDKINNQKQSKQKERILISNYKKAVSFVNANH